MLETRKVHVLS